MRPGITQNEALWLVSQAREDYKKTHNLAAIEKLVREDTRPDKDKSIAYLWAFRKAMAENDAVFAKKMYQLIHFSPSSLFAAIDIDFATSKYLPRETGYYDPLIGCAYTEMLAILQKATDPTGVAFLQSRALLADDGKSLVAALLAVEQEVVEYVWRFIPSPEEYVNELSWVIEKKLSPPHPDDREFAHSMTDYYLTIHYLFPEDNQQAIRDAFGAQIVNIGKRNGFTVFLGGSYDINITKDTKSLSRADVGVGSEDEAWYKDKRKLAEIYASEVRKGIFSSDDVSKLVIAITSSDADDYSMRFLVTLARERYAHLLHK